MLVKDEASVLVGMRLLLDTEPDLTLVVEAPDCAAALDLASSLCPDVVLMDVDMPCLDGIAVTRALHLIVPEAVVIMWTICDDALAFTRAPEAGAAAFVVNGIFLLPTLAASSSRSARIFVLRHPRVTGQLSSMPCRRHDRPAQSRATGPRSSQVDSRWLFPYRSISEEVSHDIESSLVH